MFYNWSCVSIGWRVFDEICTNISNTVMRQLLLSLRLKIDMIFWNGLSSPASSSHKSMTLQMSIQSSYFHQLTRGSFPKISNRVGMFFREWQMMKIITIRIEIRASFCSRFLKTESVLLLRVWKERQRKVDTQTL